MTPEEIARALVHDFLKDHKDAKAIEEAIIKVLFETKKRCLKEFVFGPEDHPKEKPRKA